jgi:hypothetical protein
MNEYLDGDILINKKNKINEECIICFYDKPMNEFVILECNDIHKVCINCYSKIDKCPFCYKEINLIHNQMTQMNIVDEIVNEIVNESRINSSLEERLRIYEQNDRIFNILCRCFCCILCISIIFFFVLFNMI